MTELLREGWEAPIAYSETLCTVGIVLGIVLVLCTDHVVEAMGITIGKKSSSFIHRISVNIVVLQGI